MLWAAWTIIRYVRNAIIKTPEKVTGSHPRRAFNLGNNRLWCIYAPVLPVCNRVREAELARHTSGTTRNATHKVMPSCEEPISVRVSRCRVLDCFSVNGLVAKAVLRRSFPRANACLKLSVAVGMQDTHNLQTNQFSWKVAAAQSL